MGEIFRAEMAQRVAWMLAEMSNAARIIDPDEFILHTPIIDTLYGPQDFQVQDTASIKQTILNNLDSRINVGVSPNTPHTQSRKLTCPVRQYPKPISDAS